MTIILDMYLYVFTLLNFHFDFTIDFSDKLDHNTCSNFHFKKFRTEYQFLFRKFQNSRKFWNWNCWNIIDQKSFRLTSYYPILHPKMLSIPPITEKTNCSKIASDDKFKIIKTLSSPSPCVPHTYLSLLQTCMNISICYISFED